jgi:hypothetical protein
MTGWPTNNLRIILLKPYNIDELVQIVWKVLRGMPIEVFDDENYSVWENCVWELVDSRLEGDFKGSRVIGSANVVAALNILHQKILVRYTEAEEDTTKISMSLFKNILEALSEQKLIRRKPEKLRQTFKIVK